MTPHEMREIRKQLGMTQGKLATVLHVSVSTVQNAERGLRVRQRYIDDLGRLSRGETPVREPLIPLAMTPFGAEGTDLHVVYTKAQRAIDALYRFAKDAQRLNASRVASAATTAPRPARLTPTEIAQRQVDTRAERRRLSEERIAQQTEQWNADALAKVNDCAQRWPYLSRPDILMEIENLRNTPVLGDHQRLLDFIDVYIHTGRPATPSSPEDAHLFAPGEYRSSGRLFIPPMPQ